MYVGYKHINLSTIYAKETTENVQYKSKVCGIP